MNNEEIRQSQHQLLELATLTFVEEVDGRVPTDPEIMQHTIWARFSATPLTVFSKQNVDFHDYFIWRAKHVIALSFDPARPLDLRVVRLTRDDWSPALSALLAQNPSP